MTKFVDICGIPYKVIERQENFGDGNCGEIDYRKQLITLNEQMAKQYKEQTLIHEMVHGILVCIGRNDLSEDETFVQTLANGIYTSSLKLDVKEK